MYLVAIAWLYVTLMMALAEATNPHGTILGAVFTLLLYGIGPLALVMYLLGTPMRRKARQAEESAQEDEAKTTTEAMREGTPPG
jgi:hypothetical protein